MKLSVHVVSALVNNPTYSVTLSKYITKLLRECRVEITVSGRGIGDRYDVPCSVYGFNVIATDRVLVVRNRDERNPQILYSDTHSVMVDSYQGKCIKYTYHTVNGQTTIKDQGMTKKSCEEIETKVALEERKATNPLKEAKRKIKLGFQKMFPPEFFEALKTDKPDDDVYSPGWNSWGSGPR